MSKVVDLLGDKTSYYLDHTCKTIDKSLIYIPSPDTIDKVWIDSDRNIKVLNSLQTLLGRGLLANPALALEYKENRTLAPDEMRDRLKSMHKSVYNNYDVLLEGGEGQLLTKMKTFWEYLAPQADRKVLKAIHKSTNISKYYQAVGAFFNQR